MPYKDILFQIDATGSASREAGRAQRDALPLLSGDCVVEIRIAQPKHDHADAALSRRHLERHGYRVNIKVVADEGQSISAWLVGQAVEAGCDLIIMGLDVRKRFQELVLGHVSQDLLYDLPLPVFISIYRTGRSSNIHIFPIK